MSFKLLVPTDFSPSAHNAMEYAIELAKKLKAKIVLAHAYHLNYLSSEIPMPYLAGQLAAAGWESEELLQGLCKKIKDQHGIECDFINKERLASDLIADCIRWENPSFIVMGTKGATGIKEMVFGSNTAHVIENATCPVLAIPKNTTFRHIQQITFATNYIDGDLEAITEISKFAAVFSAHITVLHVCEDGLSDEVENEDMNKFQDKIAKLINYDKMDYQLIYGKYLEKTLEAYIKRVQPDILAMSTHRRNLFNRLFRTGDTKKMAFHIRIPLLTFHNKL